MKNTLTLALIALLFAIFCLLTVPKALTLQEDYECQKLATYAENYPDFYYTSSQKEMCDIANN